MTPELERDALGDHLDRLFRAAWAMCGSREDAEDLVQETYARVLSKRRMIRSREDTLPYLLTVLRNTYISSLRTRQRRPRTAPLEDSEDRLAAPASSTPLSVLAAREVFAAIAALPDDQRDVLAAVDVAGLSYQEAADALDVPLGTVMSRLYRGRNRVAETVGPGCNSVHPHGPRARGQAGARDGRLGRHRRRPSPASSPPRASRSSPITTATRMRRGRSAGPRSARTCATRRRSMRCSSRRARSTCAWPTPACGRARTCRWPNCRSSAGGRPSTAT